MSLEKLKKAVPHEFTGDIDFIDESVKKLNLDKKAKILDIGTGFGIMAIILALNGYNVLTGEPEDDPGREEWGHSDDHHAEHGYNWERAARAVGVKDRIKYQYFDAQDQNFPDESFDGIFVYDALQHVKDRKLALRECVRIMKSDGLVSVIETNKEGIRHYQETEGWAPDYVDPREILDQDDVSIEVMSGQHVNMYVLRKK